MVVHTHLENNTFVIELTGELDACSSILVDRVIVEAIARHPQQIIVDCKNLTYISSAGLGMFMSYIQKLSSENIHLVLHSLNPTIKDIFNIMGLDELIPIVPSEQAAYAFCNKKNMLVNITSNGD